MSIIESISIRKLKSSDDLSNYLKMINDKKNTQNIQGIGDEYIGLDYLVNFINNYDGILFGIFLDKSIHIGNISFSNFNEKICNVGILMSENYQGRGFSKRALILALKKIFKHTKIVEVILYVVITNKSAIKLYESIGFKSYGKIPNQFHKNGIYKDSYLYSILKKWFNSHY